MLIVLHANFFACQLSSMPIIRMSIVFMPIVFIPIVFMPIVRMPIVLAPTRLPVTRWVKLSLNFELLVKRVMKFLLGQRLFKNNIFCTT